MRSTIAAAVKAYAAVRTCDSIASSSSRSFQRSDKYRSSYRVCWLPVFHQRAQSSEVGGKRRFGKPFPVPNLTVGCANGTFLLMEVAKAAKGVNNDQCYRHPFDVVMLYESIIY